MKTIAVDEANPAVAEDAIRAYLQAQLQHLSEPPKIPSIVQTEEQHMLEPSPKKPKPSSGFLFALVQPVRIPSISEMPGYQPWIGQHIKNLYDVYFQESLSDSPSDIDEFIQKYGLDRILHQGELEALAWKNSGTYFYKIYRDSAYEILKTIPVDVFDHYVAENAIQAYIQAEMDQLSLQPAEPAEPNHEEGFLFMFVQPEKSDSDNEQPEPSPIPGDNPCTSSLNVPANPKPDEKDSKAIRDELIERIVQREADKAPMWYSHCPNKSVDPRQTDEKQEKEDRETEGSESLSTYSDRSEPVMEDPDVALAIAESGSVDLFETFEQLVLYSEGYANTHNKVRTFLHKYRLDRILSPSEIQSLPYTDGKYRPADESFKELNHQKCIRLLRAIPVDATSPQVAENAICALLPEGTASAMSIPDNAPENTGQSETSATPAQSNQSTGSTLSDLQPAESSTQSFNQDEQDQEILDDGEEDEPPRTLWSLWLRIAITAGDL